MVFKPVYWLSGVIVPLTLSIGAIPAPVLAGCYSDWCAGQQGGSAAIQRDLKYGGTYGQAGADYYNHTHPHTYSAPSRQGGGQVYRPARPVSPQQQQEIQRLNRQSEALINQINRQMRSWH
jgi:hypothetical protein